MGLTYFKRFRMEMNLARGQVTVPDLPEPYFWVPWQRCLIDLHAEVKFQSFRREIDSEVFPCLGDRYGCRQLMREITEKKGFLPETTWLIGRCRSDQAGRAYCGTIQGLSEPGPVGAVQNLGVVPDHRGRGLGRALLLKALEGFQLCGLNHAFLEVTAENDQAIRLYRLAGFRRSRTVYKAVDPEAVAR